MDYKRGKTFAKEPNQAMLFGWASVTFHSVPTKTSLVFLACMKPSTFCVLGDLLWGILLMSAFCNIYSRFVNMYCRQSRFVTGSVPRFHFGTPSQSLFFCIIYICMQVSWRTWVGDTHWVLAISFKIEKTTLNKSIKHVKLKIVKFPFLFFVHILLDISGHKRCTPFAKHS